MSQTQPKYSGSSSDSGRAQRWALGDVIDFEEAEEQALSRENAELVLLEDGKALSRVFPGQKCAQIPRPKLFHAWLALVRERDTRLFGTSVDGVFRVLTVASWLVGIVLGGLAVPAYLTYNGEKPINIMVVFFGLIVLPWAITLVSVCFSLWVRGAPSKGGIGRIVASLLSRLSPEWRESWKSFTRVLSDHGKRVAVISAWSFFGLTQQVACGFGLGAWLSILFHVTAVDLAFGWESTLNVGEEIMHALVIFIATPWVWFWKAGVPTLEQVRDSRFSHLAGMEATVVEARRSWWPFIIGCLTFYVILPRFLLVGVARWMFSRSLSTLDFRRTQDIALARRLSGPLFQTDDPSRTGHLGDVAEVHVPSFTRNGSWGLLLGEGLDIDEDTVREQVEKLLHGKIQFVKRVEIDYADGNHQALEALRKNSAGVIVAVPADTNPVDAIAGTLNAFREASNSNDNVILLFGKVQRQDLWRRWIREKHLGFDLLGVPE